MRSLRALRALARVEMREIGRNPGRSWLVALLIAVPVAAMVGASALFHTTQRTPDEERARVMGSAALRVELDAGQDPEETRAALPPHARAESASFGREDVRVPGRRLAARSFAIDPNGLARGMLRVSGGRAPTSAGEVALSDVLLRGLSRSIGESVELASGPARITGAVVDPENIDMPVVLRAAGSVQPGEAHALLVDVPENEAGSVAARLRVGGTRALVRSSFGERDEFTTIAVFVIGGFGFFEAALVIAAAFAVSLRRRQREIGLLGASGAAIGDIRAALIVSALALAVVGALIGVAVGAGAAATLHPFLDGWNRRSNGALELSLLHAVGAALLGLITAGAAAAIPAASATRLPIRIALSGRRPATEGSRAWLALGVALFVAGFGAVACGARSTGDAAGLGILGGSMLGVLGLGASSPWLLGAFARFAAPLPLAWRLAVRDAGRFRSRNGPVVTAVLAGMSVSVMLAVLIGSIEDVLDVGPAAWRDDQLVVDGPSAEEIARKLSSELEGVASAPLAAAYSRGELVRARFAGDERARLEWIAVGDDELLRALDAAAASADLRAGRIVALVERTRAPGESIELFNGAGAFAHAEVASIAPTQRVNAPAFVVSTDELAALDLQLGPPPDARVIPWLVRLDSAVNSDVLTRAQDLAAESSGTSIDAASLHRAPASVFIHWVLAISIVTGLIVVFIATALSSVESASDARVLHTIGAAPSLLPLHIAARAGYLALLGCTLAIPAGLIPSYGLLRLANVTLEFALPWRALAIVALVLPTLAFAGAWIFAALRSSTPRAALAR